MVFGENPFGLYKILVLKSLEKHLKHTDFIFHSTNRIRPISAVRLTLMRSAHVCRSKGTKEEKLRET